MAQLEALLDEMRQSALRADFPRLAALAPKVEQALNDLPPLTDPQRLNRLRQMAEANGRLLEAARRGVAAARRRLEEARRTREGLQTYDGKGRRADISPLAPPAGRF